MLYQLSYTPKAGTASRPLLRAPENVAIKVDLTARIALPVGEIMQ